MEPFTLWLPSRTPTAESVRCKIFLERFGIPYRIEYAIETDHDADSSTSDADVPRIFFHGEERPLRSLSEALERWNDLQPRQPQRSQQQQQQQQQQQEDKRSPSSLLQELMEDASDTSVTSSCFCFLDDSDKSRERRRFPACSSLPSWKEEAEQDSSREASEAQEDNDSGVKEEGTKAEESSPLEAPQEGEEEEVNQEAQENGALLVDDEDSFNEDFEIDDELEFLAGRQHNGENDDDDAEGDYGLPMVDDSDRWGSADGAEPPILPKPMPALIPVTRSDTPTNYVNRRNNNLLDDVHVLSTCRSNWSSEKSLSNDDLLQTSDHKASHSRPSSRADSYSTWSTCYPNDPHNDLSSHSCHTLSSADSSSGHSLPRIAQDLCPRRSPPIVYECEKQGSNSSLLYPLPNGILRVQDRRKFLLEKRMNSLRRFMEEELEEEEEEEEKDVVLRTPSRHYSGSTSGSSTSGGGRHSSKGGAHVRFQDEPSQRRSSDTLLRNTDRTPQEKTSPNNFGYDQAPSAPKRNVSGDDCRSQQWMNNNIDMIPLPQPLPSPSFSCVIDLQPTVPVRNVSSGCSSIGSSEQHDLGDSVQSLDPPLDIQQFMTIPVMDVAKKSEEVVESTESSIRIPKDDLTDSDKSAQHMQKEQEAVLVVDETNESSDASSFKRLADCQGPGQRKRSSVILSETQKKSLRGTLLVGEPEQTPVLKMKEATSLVVQTPRRSTSSTTTEITCLPNLSSPRHDLECPHLPTTNQAKSPSPSSLVSGVEELTECPKKKASAESPGSSEHSELEEKKASTLTDEGSGQTVKTGHLTSIEKNNETHHNYPTQNSRRRVFLPDGSQVSVADLTRLLMENLPQHKGITTTHKHTYYFFYGSEGIAVFRKLFFESSYVSDQDVTSFARKLERDEYGKIICNLSPTETDYRKSILCVHPLLRPHVLNTFLNMRPWHAEKDDEEEEMILPAPKRACRTIKLNASAVMLDLSIMMDEIFLCISEGKSQDFGGSLVDRFEESVSNLQVVDLHFTSPDESTAFFLNLFNLMLRHALLKGSSLKQEPKWPKKYSDLKPFLKSIYYEVGGNLVSLSDVQSSLLENRSIHSGSGSEGKLIRHARALGAWWKQLLCPRYWDCCQISSTCAEQRLDPPCDERLLFCISYGTESSPQIRTIDPSSLERDLQFAATSFCKHIHIKPNKKGCTIKLPQMFDWYRGNFPGNGSKEKTFECLIKYLSTEQMKTLFHCSRDHPRGKWKIRFEKYKWYFPSLPKPPLQLSLPLLVQQDEQKLPASDRLSPIQEIGFLDTKTRPEGVATSNRYLRHEIDDTKSLMSEITYGSDFHGMSAQGGPSKGSQYFRRSPVTVASYPERL